MFSNLATYIFSLWTAAASISYIILVTFYIYFSSAQMMSKQHLAFLIGAAAAFMLSLVLLYISDHTNIYSVDNLFPLWNGVVIVLWLVSTWLLGDNKALLITASAIVIAGMLTAIFMYFT